MFARRHRFVDVSSLSPSQGEVWRCTHCQRPSRISHTLVSRTVVVAPLASPLPRSSLHSSRSHETTAAPPFSMRTCVRAIEGSAPPPPPLLSLVLPPVTSVMSGAHNCDKCSGGIRVETRITVSVLEIRNNYSVLKNGLTFPPRCVVSTINTVYWYATTLLGFCVRIYDRGGVQTKKYTQGRPAKINILTSFVAV